jgi:hypothetical protein
MSFSGIGHCVLGLFSKESIDSALKILYWRENIFSGLLFLNILVPSDPLYFSGDVADVPVHLQASVRIPS